MSDIHEVILSNQVHLSKIIAVLLDVQQNVLCLTGDPTCVSQGEGFAGFKKMPE